MHLQVGQRIQGDAPHEVFEVVKLLGEGQAGEVYEVRDCAEGEEADERRALMSEMGELSERYAMKIARAEPGGLAAVNARIEREWRVLVKLTHRGICRPVAHGEHEGREAFVTERLEGRTLGEHLRTEQRVLLRDRLQLFLQLAEALACCHEAGIAHRDLRPSNVLVVPGRGPVIIGFDSCGLFSKSGPADEVRPLGAAEYLEPARIARLLSPEAEVSLAGGPRSDVYAMGVLLYSMLTGRLPVVAASSDPIERLRELVDARPVHPSALFPEVPAAAADLAMTLLSKDRPSDVRDLPALVRVVMDRDQAALARFAPEYDADSETLIAPEALANVPPARVEPVRPVSRRVAGARMLWRYGGPVAFAAMALITVMSVRHGRDKDIENERLLQLNLRLSELNSRLSQERSDAQATLENVLKEIARQAPNVKLGSILQASALGGLKMPDKPLPNWLKPRSDGKCYDPETGSRLQGYEVHRGTCWRVTANASYMTDPPQKRPCPGNAYDPPPEAPAEDRGFCYHPVEIPTTSRKEMPQKPAK